MRDLHEVIIHHVRQVVRRMPVGLEQDRVIVDAINVFHLITAGFVLPGLSVDQVLEHRVPVGLQPNDMRLALCGPLLRFFRGDIEAFPVITGRESRLVAMSR